MPDGFMGSERPFRASRKQQGHWYKLIKDQTIPAGSEASFHSDVEEEGVEKSQLHSSHNISSVDLLITFFNLFFKMSNIAIASDNFQHHCSMYCQSFHLSQTAGDRQNANKSKVHQK
ncbi:hypothetical protein T06_14451 [Trichinella sp. T6]|nr:hypothetical protein T06_14451 [Trichinella sp. T6]